MRLKPLCALILLMPLSTFAQHGAPGAAVCGRCHVEEARDPSGMVRAASNPADSWIFRARSSLTFQDGNYQYELRQAGPQVIYTVTDGRRTFTTPLDWALGSSKMGQAFLFRRNGAWYETQVSYYRVLDHLGRMLGGTPPGNLEEAIGSRLPDHVARGCFTCHANGESLPENLDTAHLVPGVQCERCHQGAAVHAAAALKGGSNVPNPPSLAQLSAEDISELCGRCHRTWSQIILNGPRSLDNVRFQPYRLANSKCFAGADARVSCTACHDPHHELEQSLQAYDAKCFACHGGTAVPIKGLPARVCSVGTGNCVSCHMPRYKLPSTQEEFTDHDIRIVKGGEPYPN